MVDDSSSSKSLKDIDNKPVPTNEDIAAQDLYTDPEMRPPIFKSALQEYVCVAAIILSPAAFTMAISSFQTSLSVVAAQFHVEGGRLTWAVNAILLANGACLLLMGGVSDAVGRRYALIAGFFCYSVFTLIAGFMNDYIALCILRALMGASVSCSMPATAGFVGSVYKDSKRKNMVLSLYALGSSAGAFIGFWSAGICVQFLSWRAYHWWLAIVYGILTTLVVIFFPFDETKMRKDHAKEVLKSIDYGGAFISMAAFTLICFALTQVDATERRWNTPYIIGTLVAGIVLIAVFVLWELYVPAEPLMPMQLFKNYNFDICMVLIGFTFMTFQGALAYFGVLYFEAIRHYNTIIVACCVLPQIIVGLFVNLFAGFTMHIIPGKYYPLMGGCALLITSCIMATLDTHRNYFLGPFWAFAFSPIGSDFTYNIANRVTLNSVSKELQSRASGTFNTIFSLGAAIGLGINSAIVSSKYELYGTAEQNAHPEEFWDAIHNAYYFVIGLESACIILSLFLKVGVLGAKKSEDEENVEPVDKNE